MTEHLVPHNHSDGRRSQPARLLAPHRQSLLDLLVDADVLVENFRVGVMDTFGLSYEELHARFGSGARRCSSTHEVVTARLLQQPLLEQARRAVWRLASN